MFRSRFCYRFTNNIAALGKKSYKFSNENHLAAFLLCFRTQKLIITLYPWWLIFLFTSFYTCFTLPNTLACTLVFFPPTSFAFISSMNNKHNFLCLVQAEWGLPKSAVECCNKKSSDCILWTVYISDACCWGRQRGLSKKGGKKLGFFKRGWRKEETS